MEHITEERALARQEESERQDDRIAEQKRIGVLRPKHADHTTAALVAETEQQPAPQVGE